MARAGKACGKGGDRLRYHAARSSELEIPGAMTSSSRNFGPHSGQELLQLVRDHPLAWLVSGAGEQFRATLLPLLPVHSAGGRLVAFAGHLARANPQVEALRHDRRATVLLLGPNAYVSPSWMTDRSQAPTWNYASAQCLVEIEFLDDAEALGGHLRELVDTMEDECPGRWEIAEMGPRYPLLAKRIICFVAHVRELREKYKLGQDERDDVYADIARGLAAEGADALLGWMRRLNPGRKD